jgi:hypothetical protein
MGRYVTGRDIKGADHEEPEIPVRGDNGHHILFVIGNMISSCAGCMELS